MTESEQGLPGQDGGASFRTTHWSVVLAAGRADSAAAREALERLCRAYWYPLYAYVRRRGCSPEDAEDVTQGFFAQLLARQDLATVSPEKGRFRTFLLAALGHYLANEWRRAHRQKRGGGAAVVALDALSAEERYRCEPVTAETPERLYDRRWAAAVMEQALAALREDYARTGRAELFERLKPALTGAAGGLARAELAVQLGISVGAVDVALHRLRRRYGEFIRTIIADTVSRPEDVDAEIRELQAMWGG
jgi:RNA polymerase sigma-70 factor (ECF subfamily)